VVVSVMTGAGVGAGATLPVLVVAPATVIAPLIPTVGVNALDWAMVRGAAPASRTPTTTPARGRLVLASRRVPESVAGAAGATGLGRLIGEAPGPALF
jgi:hypothetical protein